MVLFPKIDYVIKRRIIMSKIRAKFSQAAINFFRWHAVCYCLLFSFFTRKMHR